MRQAPTQGCVVRVLSGVMLAALLINTASHISVRSNGDSWRGTSSRSRFFPPRIGVTVNGPRASSITLSAPFATARAATEMASVRPSMGEESYAAANHTEFWGALVDAGTSNLQPTAAACCQSCREYEPSLDVLRGAQCNTWVWHPERHECWLKFQEEAPLQSARKQVVAAASVLEGGAPPSRVPWVSGVWLGKRKCTSCVVPKSYAGCISKDMCNTSRACGSPAIDGYGHVDAACFERSPTARAYSAHLDAGGTLEAHSELRSDYDGLGVHWGIGHKKQKWEDCERACFEHMRRLPSQSSTGPYSRLPCNAWTWCSRPKCFEPDAHSHSFGDCWLKFTEKPEAPEVNMREPMLRSFIRRHRKEMAEGVPWVSGVLLLPGTPFTNGTWGPRAYW